MKRAYSNALVHLQSAIHAAPVSVAGEPCAYVIPFLVGSRSWFIEPGSVNRLLMPSALFSVIGYQGLPRSVVGSAAFAGEILTVIDAGLLLGGEAVIRSYKARLIALRSPGATGVAILVDRVLDRCPASEVGDDCTRFDASQVLSMLQSS